MKLFVLLCRNTLRQSKELKFLVFNVQSACAFGLVQQLLRKGSGDQEREAILPVLARTVAAAKFNANNVVNIYFDVTNPRPNYRKQAVELENTLSAAQKSDMIGVSSSLERAIKTAIDLATLGN